MLEISSNKVYVSSHEIQSVVIGMLNMQTDQGWFKFYKVFLDSSIININCLENWEFGEGFPIVSISEGWD